MITFNCFTDTDLMPILKFSSLANSRCFTSLCTIPSALCTYCTITWFYASAIFTEGPLSRIANSFTEVNRELTATAIALSVRWCSFSSLSHIAKHATLSFAVSIVSAVPSHHTPKLLSAVSFPHAITDSIWPCHINLFCH